MIKQKKLITFLILIVFVMQCIPIYALGTLESLENQSQIEKKADTPFREMDLKLKQLEKELISPEQRMKETRELYEETKKKLHKDKKASDFSYEADYTIESVKVESSPTEDTINIFGRTFYGEGSLISAVFKDKNGDILYSASGKALENGNFMIDIPMEHLKGYKDYQVFVSSSKMTTYNILEEKKSSLVGKILSNKSMQTASMEGSKSLTAGISAPMIYTAANVVDGVEVQSPQFVDGVSDQLLQALVPNGKLKFKITATNRNTSPVNVKLNLRLYDKNENFLAEKVTTATLNYNQAQTVSATLDNPLPANVTGLYATADLVSVSTNKILTPVYRFPLDIPQDFEGRVVGKPDPNDPNKVIGDQLYLSWSPVVGAHSYTIYKDDEPIESINATSKSLEYQGTLKDNATIYKFNVKAFSADNSSLASKTVKAAKGDLNFPLSGQSNYTLDADCLFEKVHIKSGSFNLAGFTLKTFGVFEVGDTGGASSGVFVQNKGQLFVLNNGDFGIYGSSTMSMTNPEDYIYVQGNFYFKTNISHDSTKLSAGTLEVNGGTFQKIYSEQVEVLFSPGVSHRVALTGPGVQTIEFSNDFKSKFNILQINKPLDTGYKFLNGRAALTDWYVTLENIIYQDAFTGYDGLYGPTGNFSRAYTDMTLEAPGLDINIGRVYNASQVYKKTKRGSTLGKGWSFSYEGSIEDEAAVDGAARKTKIAYLPGGEALRFTYTGTESPTTTFTPEFNRAELKKDASNKYILTMKDFTTYEFNPQGWLTAIKDMYGNKLTITVDASGKVDQVSDQTGRNFKVVYDDAVKKNYIMKIQDYIGTTLQREVNYEYKDGLLERVRDPLGNVTSMYSYTSLDYLKQIRDGYDKLIESVVFYNNASGKISTTTDAYGKQTTISYVNGKTLITDNNNRTTTQEYNAKYAITKTIDPDTRWTSVDVNDYGEESIVIDRDGNKTVYTRDENGNVTQIDNPDGSKKLYGYYGTNLDPNKASNQHIKNLIMWELDEEGNYAYYKYDSLRQLINKCVYRKKIKDTSRPVYTGSNGSNFIILTYEYYNAAECAARGYVAGLLKAEIQPNYAGSTTPPKKVYDYDSTGNLSKVTDAEKKKDTIYVYDPVVRKQQAIKKPVVTSTSGTTYSATFNYYDANGKLEKSVVCDSLDEATATSKSTTRYVYDIMGRLVQKITPNLYNQYLDNLAGHTYNDPNAGYRYTYYRSTDEYAKEIDPENNERKYLQYDIYGNLTVEQKPANNPTDASDPEATVYQYEYDSVNRLSKTYHVLTYTMNANGTIQINTKEILEEYDETLAPEPVVAGVTTNNFYHLKKTKKYLDATNVATTLTKIDYEGRLCKTIYEPDSTTDKVEITNEYYLDGELKSSIDGLGYKTLYTYGYEYEASAAGREVEHIWTPSEAANGKATWYVYTRIINDDNGNKKEEHVRMAKVATDAATGEPTQAQRTAVEGEAITSTTYYSTITTYNANNKVIEIVDYSGRKEKYNYDDAGNLKDEYIYTEPSYSNANAIWTEYVYDYLDKPAREKMHVRNGDIQGNDFADNTDRTLEIIYNYDLEGNVITVYDPMPAYTTSNYYYDNLGRLEGEGRSTRGANYTKYYTLNWEGNVVSETDYNSKTTYCKYNWQGLPEEIKTSVAVWNGSTDTQKDCITAMSYDRAGRKVAEVSPNNYVATTLPTATDNRFVYGYDKFDRLTSTKFYGKEKKVDPLTGQWQATDTLINNRTIASYQYDKNGNLIKETDAAGYSTEYQYTPDEKLERQLDQVNKDRKMPFTVKYAYDVLGRVSKETYVKNDASSTTVLTDDQAKGIEISYQYAMETAPDLYKYLVMKKSITSFDSYTGMTGLLESSRYDLTGNVLEYRKYVDGTVFNTINYTYNKFNKVQQMDMPYSDSTLPAKISRTVYQYDVLGNLDIVQAQMNTLTDTSDDIFEEYNQNIFNEVNSYIKRTSTSSEWVSLGWNRDANGNILDERDGRGNYTSYAYDEMNRVKSKSITVNGKVHESLLKYDADGNLVKEVGSVDGTVVNQNTYKYDGMGRLIEKFDADNVSVEKIEYNTRNLQEKSYQIFEENGADIYTVTSFGYDNNGRQISTTDPLTHVNKLTYDNHGNVKQKIDGKNQTTTYKYDGLDRLREVSNAKYEVTYFTYDYSNNLLTQKTGRGYTTTYEYNSSNKVKKKIDNGGRSGTPGSYTYVASKCETYVYHPDGSLKEKTDRNGEKTSYKYYGLGWLKEQTAGTTNTLVTSYTYDNDGNPLTVTMQDNQTSKKEEITREYDAINRVTSKSLKKNTDTVPYVTLSYTYDIITTGSLLAEKVTDSKNNSTSKVYDKVGRLKYVIDGDITTTGGNISTFAKTEYIYSKNGNRKSVSYPGGAVEEYTYYRDNLLKTIINKKPDASVIDQITYTYDNAHNQTSKDEQKINGVAKGITKYYYDELNRLKKVAEPANAQGVTRNTTYIYDGDGNRRTESVIFGTSLTTKVYNYNDQNRVQNVRSYTTEYISNMTPVSSINGYGPMEIDKSNGENLAGDGRTITLNGVEYDKGLGVHAASEQVYNLGAAYTTFICDVGVDDEVELTAGNVARVRFQVYVDSVLKYDSGEMTSGSPTKSIVLDVTNGNQLKLVVDAGTATTNDHADWADARLIKAATSTATYAYDYNGNLKTETRDGKTYTHTYNKLNQLATTSFTDNGQSVIVTNTYNGEGYRVEKSVTRGTSTQTTRYVYEGDKVVLELDALGNQTARNIYGSNLLKRTVGTSESYYYMYNAHGDVTALLNASTGQVAATYYYDAFGNLVNSTGTVNNNITYAGYQYDSETKLYYLNSRMYDPLTARFLQEDTYTGDPNDPLSLNLYTYCHNSPIMYSDPDGHEIKLSQIPDVIVGLGKGVIDEFALPSPWDIKDSIIALKDLAAEIVSGNMGASDLAEIGLDAIFGDFIYLYKNGHKAFDDETYSNQEIEDLAFHTAKALCQIGSLAAGGAGVVTKIKGFTSKVKNLKKSLTATKKIVSTSKKTANVVINSAEDAKRYSESLAKTLQPAAKNGINKVNDIKTTKSSSIKKVSKSKAKKNQKKVLKDSQKTKKYSSGASSKPKSTKKVSSSSNSKKASGSSAKKSSGSSSKKSDGSSSKKSNGDGSGKSGSDSSAGVERRTYYTGAREVHEVDALAKKAYESIRKVRYSDVKKVAANTGLSRREIRAMKKHIFFDKHKMPIDGKGNWINERFTPDDHIAYAWKTAQKRKLTPEEKISFRELADHELTESRYMKNGLPYRDPKSFNEASGRFDISEFSAHDISPVFRGFHGYDPLNSKWDFEF